MSEPDGRPQHVEQRGPTELSDPFVRQELKRASIWLAVFAAALAVGFLAQPLLLVLGGIVFSAILDGGTRLLGRVLPIARGWRLAIVTLTGLALIVGTFVYAGFEIAAQAQAMRTLVTGQVSHLLAWGSKLGLGGENGFSLNDVGNQLMGSVGRLTSAVGTALGAITSIVMIVVIGVFIAVEPRLYQRGIAWMLPMRSRDAFYRTGTRMGRTLRRLMFGRIVGMVFEGFFMWLFLMIGGVPMALLLGIITGLLAFLPNIGAIISGILTVLVGFSAGTDTGLWAIGVYFIIQTIDGYLVVPFVARRTVDLAPALVLGAQLLFGALFGILGLFLADPIVAMTKAALEQKTREDERVSDAEPI